MLYIIKNQKVKNDVRKFCIPPQLSKKLNWNKSQAFMMYAYDQRVFILEPVEEINIKSTFLHDDLSYKHIYYVKPLGQYVNFGFHIPKEIFLKLDLNNIKLLAVHETGTKTIFLEAFTNGTEKR